MSEIAWWRRTTMLAVVLMMIMMAAGNAVRRPQEEDQQDDSRNPVFNIWEFALGNSNYSPTKEPTPVKDPCTWAIIKCCRITFRNERDLCFANNHCPGAWFNNLCSKKFKGLTRTVIHSAFSDGF